MLLIELGFISNANDLNQVLNKIGAACNAIVTSFGHNSSMVSRKPPVLRLHKVLQCLQLLIFHAHIMKTELCMQLNVIRLKIALQKRLKLLSGKQLGKVLNIIKLCGVTDWYG